MAFSGNVSGENSVLFDISRRLNQNSMDKLGVLKAFPAPKVPLIQPVKPSSNQIQSIAGNQQALEYAESMILVVLKATMKIDYLSTV